MLLKCFAGCSVKDIAAAIGIEMRDLFPTRQLRGAEVKGRTRASITVEGLAELKAFSPEFLASLGLKNIPHGVQIPYRLPDGTPAPRQRIRTALSAKKGSRWTMGAGVIVPYGLWRLEEARKAGFLVLVEGESDCWTLWFHNFPCLGLPGADMAG